MNRAGNARLVLIETMLDDDNDGGGGFTIMRLWILMDVIAVVDNQAWEELPAKRMRFKSNNMLVRLAQ
jgi:hypothetical protein